MKRQVWEFNTKGRDAGSYPKILVRNAHPERSPYPQTNTFHGSLTSQSLRVVLALGQVRGQVAGGQESRRGRRLGSRRAAPTVLLHLCEAASETSLPSSPSDHFRSTCCLVLLASLPFLVAIYSFSLLPTVSFEPPGG